MVSFLTLWWSSLVKNGPLGLRFTSFRGFGLSAIEKRLLPGDTESVGSFKLYPVANVACEACDAQV